MVNPRAFDPVRPGDIITSARYNALVQALTDIEVRLSRLENGAGGSGVRIDRFVPETGQEVGLIVEIRGANFIEPARNPTTGQVANIISINGSPIPADHYVFAGSSTSSSSLSFRAPSN